MSRRQTLPHLWLMTDERLGEGLLPTIAALPHGSGVVFRHYSLAEAERHALFRSVKRLCLRHDHLLLLAGTPLLARRWGADGYHGRHRNIGDLLHSAPVHDRHELRIAKRLGADIFFISPVFPTASHPDAPTLGADGFRKLAAQAGNANVIALGGMNAARAKALGPLAHGWAGIDAFKI